MHGNKVFLSDLPLTVKCCPHCGGRGCERCGFPPPPPCGCGCGCGCGCCCVPLPPCGCRPAWPKEDYLPEGEEPQLPPPRPCRKDDAAVFMLRDSWRLPPCAEIVSAEACIDGWEAAQDGCCRCLCVRYHLLICWREHRHLRRTCLEAQAYLPWPQGACPGDLLLLVCSPPQVRCCGCGVVEICTKLDVTW